MLGSSVPSSPPAFTETTSASPSRGGRRRGLSYLRSYTQNHLATLTLRSDAHPLTRSNSSPSTPPVAVEREETSGSERSGPNQARPTTLAAEEGGLPTIQGRSVLDRDATQITTTSTPAATSNSSTAPSTTRQRTVNAPTPAASGTSNTTVMVDAALVQSDLPVMNETAAPAREPSAPLPTIRFIPHVEQRSNRPSLEFTAVSRTLKTANGVVRVGRYSERDNSSSDPPVGFKSKVVSRRHCEFWCTDGQWYIKDVKSSSGTFLNHVRLSSPGVESRPYPVNDGDVVQLGIDFKGGEEVIFRCVKIRVECNRGWQKSLNSFNTSAHKRLFKSATKAGKRDSDAASVGSSECSICLNPVAPCQALFVAPCSHVWHYKCISNVIHGPNYPNFLCPNCRFNADLDADVEQPESFEEYDDKEFLEQIEESDANEHKEVQQNVKQVNGDVSDGQGAVGSHTNPEDDLADQLSRSSLQDHSASASNAEPAENSSSLPQTLNERRSGTTQPIPITSRKPREPSSEVVSGRSPTPTSTAQFALAVQPSIEGPMTPRNDAGPYVLDGGAGRSNTDEHGGEVNGRAHDSSGSDSGGASLT